MRLSYGTVDAGYAERLATIGPSDDGPVWMVNYMRYRPVAVYADGRPATISGREADDLYAPLNVLAAIGAEVALFGEVVVGDGAERDWDRVAIVRYPTRRSFVEMQARPDFQELYVHKEAGMEFTIIFAAIPLDVAPSAPGPARFIDLTAYSAGGAPPPLGDDALRFDVEGVVIGDERRFEMLDIAWSDDAARANGPDGMAVRIVPVLDRIRDLLPQAA